MNRFFVLLIAALFLLTSCNQFEPIEEEENDCLVSFNLRGEITSSDAPMTKTSSDDLYYVQIYRGSEAFAFGIFDNPGFKFNLKVGSQKYRIIVGMIRNGKMNSGFRYSSVNNSLDPDFYDTFEIRNFAYWFPINSYYYNNVKTIHYYGSANSTSISSYNRSDHQLSNCMMAQTNVGGIDKYPLCDDWFYGEIYDYSPLGTTETLDLNLRRVCFKIKYELAGVTDGEVRVKIYNNDKTFIDNTTNTSTYISAPQLFAFNNTHDAWQYADDYIENFTLAVSWLRGIGITVDYGTKTIQLKRNCLNNIKINLGSNDQNAGMNLTVEAESTIGADNVTIPVE